MGTWGTGIFDNDISGDVRDAFEDEIMAGADVATATSRVLTKFRTSVNDSDNRPVIYLALAALQLEYGALQEDIRKQALEMIDNEDNWYLWEESDPVTQAERRDVLKTLRLQLTQ